MRRAQLLGVKRLEAVWIDGGFQSLPSLKLGLVGSLDVNPLAGSGIAPHRRSAANHAKGAEANKANRGSG